MTENHKKRILIVTPGFFPLFGGMEEQCYILAREFIRIGYKVDLLTEQTKPTFPLKENIEGINVFRLKHVKKRDVFGFIKLISNLIIFLLKSRKQYNFCIIRTFTIHALIIGFLKSMRLISYKTWVTADTGGENDDIISLQKRHFSKIIIYFLKFHDYFNSICHDNLAHYQKLGFPKKRLTSIYNGIVTDQYKKQNNPKEINSFLYLGRLSKTKGIRELLYAFQRIVIRYPKKKLYIGGDGDEKGFVQDFIKQNNLEKNIIYVGYVSKEQKDDFYINGECFVLPSYSEGFSITILEATIRCKVIIATDVSDLKKLYGDSIIFCKKADVNDLEKKMESVIKQKPNFNYDKVVEIVDIKKTANDILSLIA